MLHTVECMRNSDVRVSLSSEWERIRKYDRQTDRWIAASLYAPLPQGWGITHFLKS